ncbi:unnamed protein product [Tilletia controversa]|nr:unnamed protein product [Tilletia caries]CAD6907161.1 unnamed protein product [Tilletia laevis]CAD6933903.1 unnamed protein product [Tilletia laevis]CAD6940839.1 unnamed protein product [Tilletia controversa]CAD7066602.1 unnamed protein product [Tilletia caries]
MASTSSHHHAHHAHCSHSHHEPLRYSQPTQADEDLLNLITSPTFHTPTRRPLSTLAALRRPPIDPIVLAATLSSGPHVTRHHFHHSFDGQPPDVRRSQQMPASLRRARMVQSHQQEQHAQTHVKAQQRDREAVTSSAARASAAAAALSPPPAPTPEAPRYISAQAPRSVRLAREPGTAESNPHLQKPPAAPTPTPTAPTESITSTSTRRPSTATAAPASVKTPPQLVVRCHARTRIPTPHGEVFAYIYKNNLDNKEHLALVVDPSSNDEGAVEYYRSVSKASGRRVSARKGEIRSRSLDELWSVGESDMERIVRGAYVGRLGADYQIASAPPLPLPSSSSLLEEDEDEEEELEPPLVRIHSECYTGETIGSQRCDCGEQLDEAIRLIAAEDEIMNPPRHRHHSHSQARQQSRRRGKDVEEEHLAFSQQLPPSDAPLTGAPPSPALSSSQQFFPFSPNPNNNNNNIKPPRRARGIVVYLRQEGRGIGLLDKLMAYNLQDMGHDTVSANILLGHSADARTYDIAAAMLRDLGVGVSTKAGDGSGVRLLTNNPEKVEGMEREGVRVVERVPMVPRMWRTRGESSGRRRRARESSKRKKAKKERGGGGGKRASGMTPSSSAGAGTGTGTVFRPSLLGVHSRILSQASGFGTESEEDGDENAFEDRAGDGDGEFSQVEVAGSMTRSTSGQQDEEDGHASQLEHPSSPSSSRSSSPSPSPSEGSEDSDDSYTAHVLRRSGATMIGADVTRSAELERYLRTKVERMGHLLEVPGGSQGAGGSGSQGGQGSGEREKGA